MNDAEKCRAIAEWLGCQPNACGFIIGGRPYGMIPDYLHDESANARVLDRLLLAGYWIVPQQQDGRRVDCIGISRDPCSERAPYPQWVFHADRKTAIVNAALQLIAAEKREARENSESVGDCE